MTDGESARRGHVGPWIVEQDHEHRLTNVLARHVSPFWNAPESPANIGRLLTVACLDPRVTAYYGLRLSFIEDMISYVNLAQCCPDPAKAGQVIQGLARSCTALANYIERKDGSARFKLEADALIRCARHAVEAARQSPERIQFQTASALGQDASCGSLDYPILVEGLDQQ